MAVVLIGDNVLYTGDVAPVVPHQPRVPRGIIRADLPNMGPVNDVPPGNQAADEVPGATHASNQAAAIEAAPGNAAAPFEPAVKADSQTRASSSELPSELPSVPRSASSSPPDMPPQQRVVHKAVTVFVKETLNPLYKAGVIDRDVFKEVAAKSVAKVMAVHDRATDTGFLVRLNLFDSPTHLGPVSYR